MLSQEQLQSMVALLRRNPEARRQLLDALGMEQLADVPGQVRHLDSALAHLTTIVADLAAAQLRAAERLEGVEDRLARAEARLEGVEDRLARAEARLEGVEDRLARLETAVTALVESQRLIQVEIVKIQQWQVGDDGRRRGEQYERKIELRARRLLGEGMGGSPHRDYVRLHLNELLARAPDDVDLADDFDPMLADVIWWRNGSYVVVEASLRVDRGDVLRAAQRAETLRATGVDVLAVVIGEEWVSDATLALARQKGVAWKVGSDISDRLMAFRSAAEQTA